MSHIDGLNPALSCRRGAGNCRSGRQSRMRLNDTRRRQNFASITPRGLQLKRIALAGELDALIFQRGELSALGLLVSGL